MSHLYFLILGMEKTLINGTWCNCSFYFFFFFLNSPFSTHNIKKKKRTLINGTLTLFGFVVFITHISVSSPKTHKLWGSLSYSVFGQILEFNSHNSKLKNMSYKLWKLKTHFIQWQSCNYATTVGPVAVSSHVRPFETVGFTLLLCFICFSFQTQHSSLSKHHTPTFCFTLPPFIFLPSLFFPWKIQCIRSGEAVQPKTRADRRDLSPVFSSANFAILGLFFTFFLSLFHAHCRICYDFFFC